MTLKPCPFCGSNAKRTGGDVDNITICTARCSNDVCLASFKSVDDEVWNTRIGIQEADFPQFELLMRRFCMASPGESRDKAKTAILAFVAGVI